MATERELQLLRTAARAGISDRTELANFMAQVGHESGGLSRLEESFRYTRSAEQVSGKVRSALREGRPALEAARLDALAGRPEALAELMYGGRMGNTEAGDGYRYRGRGYIQLTGRETYRRAGEALGIDLERSPDLAADPENAARIALWYWQTRVPVAARDDVRAAGAAINGSDPPNGLADREQRFQRWDRALSQQYDDLVQQPRERPATSTPIQTQSEPQTRTVRSFDDVMRVMLPPQDGVAPHMTSDFGHRTLNGRADHHGGVDFNYVGGQNGINLRHPTVRSPVSGTVIYGAGQGSYGTVKIRDDAGNVHEILHLDSRSVQVTHPPTRINAGDPIGTMGGRGPNGSGQYAQHVHYQVRDPSGRTVDPEVFWRNRQIEAPGSTRDSDTPTRSTRSADPHAAIADGVLRRGERGDDVVGLQRSLNQLGVRDARGNPLAEDGRYGDRTFEAIEAYQRANGLKVDGIAGPRTLESIGNRLPGGTVSTDMPTRAGTTRPSSDPLYGALRERLPDTVSDAQAAYVTLAARRAGVDAPGKLESVVVQDGTVFVRGTTPGFRARVDLSQPMPSPAEVEARPLAAAAPQPLERQAPRPSLAI